ncbi:MAG: tyrosine-type recombinase/integrase [Mycobacterium kyogaense]|uniref:tyrosine-type recombinase/integrase n=1 Tax=Mycobacterium kyogaense TaxID=2212479 RepID=UPI002FF5A216
MHDLRHAYALLARRAGADLRILQKTMGHASITVTAHAYADLSEDELDFVASALDALDDRPGLSNCRAVGDDREDELSEAIAQSLARTNHREI